jgi:hypothetical protein
LPWIVNNCTMHVGCRGMAIPPLHGRPGTGLLFPPGSAALPISGTTPMSTGEPRRLTAVSEAACEDESDPGNERLLAQDVGEVSGQPPRDHPPSVATEKCAVLHLFEVMTKARNTGRAIVRQGEASGHADEVLGGLRAELVEDTKDKKSLLTKLRNAFDQCPALESNLMQRLRKTRKHKPFKCEGRYAPSATDFLLELANQTLKELDKVVQSRSVRAVWTAGKVLCGNVGPGGNGRTHPGVLPSDHAEMGRIESGIDSEFAHVLLRVENNPVMEERRALRHPDDLRTQERSTKQTAGDHNNPCPLEPADTGTTARSVAGAPAMEPPALAGDTGWKSDQENAQAGGGAKADGELHDLLAAARGLNIKGKELLVIEQIIKGQGSVALTDLSVVCSWKNPDDNWNSMRNRLNKKLGPKCWQLYRHDNEAKAKKLAQPKRPQAKKTTTPNSGGRK